VISLDELPSSAKLETMRLFLGCARVRFPSTSVIFTSLTDLALQWLKVTADSGDLGRLLLSECCPRLQKLRLHSIMLKHSGTKELVLQTSTLLELTMSDMDKMESLELRAPNLRALEITCCGELKVLMLSACILEQLIFSRNCLEAAIDVDLPCVKQLEINLVSHTYIDINDMLVPLGSLGVD